MKCRSWRGQQTEKGFLEVMNRASQDYENESLSRWKGEQEDGCSEEDASMLAGDTDDSASVTTSKRVGFVGLRTPICKCDGRCQVEGFQCGDVGGSSARQICARTAGTGGVTRGLSMR